MKTRALISRTSSPQLIMSAMVRAHTRDCGTLQGRVLLDTCSTAHFVTEDFARNLGLPMHPYSIPVGAINSIVTMSKFAVKITLQSNYGDFSKTLTFLTVPTIADFVPDEFIPLESINLPSKLPLADPHFHVPRPVDLLIGSGATLSLMNPGRIDLSRGAGNDLILQKTEFGWTLAGSNNDVTQVDFAICNLTELKRLMNRFWEIEDLELVNPKSTKDIDIENHYCQTTSRGTDGRYMVRFPFRQNHDALGESRTCALRRFNALERKFELDPILKEEYSRVIQEYIDLNHMSLSFGDPNDGFYLPHHAVIKASSATTKIRVVFDASAKTTTHVSLNDNLMTGPTIQDKLFEHLIRFRIYKYVIIADIEKMYRQIWIHPDDRRFQRILWRVDNKIQTFELNTVTFGVSSAPFLAIRTLQKLADDEGADYPIAKKVLKRDVYVDDLITGADTLEEIIEIRDESIDLLKRGGFNIRQWASNHEDALDRLTNESMNLDFRRDRDTVLKTLGVSWNAKTDKLLYKSRVPETASPNTKRNVLSAIAKIFDPLGLLGPVILYAKTIMQKTWKSKIGWDDLLPAELNVDWCAFTNQLPLLDTLSIDRRVLIDDFTDVQFHGFCDASKLGYGACLYVRSQNPKGEIFVQLLCAKSRVAPLKEITIPRAELCGALLLANLYKEISSSFDVDPKKVILWSDSTIVLHWLRKSPRALQPFESNRVSKIQQINSAAKWRHVRTEQNPADALSRGQLPSEFLRNDSWFTGPDWLRESEETWPNEPECLVQDLPGLRKGICLFVDAGTSELFAKFSSYPKLIRIIAYCLRMLKKNTHRGPLNIQEIADAEIRVLKLIQASYYTTEIKLIAESRKLNNSRLATLSPYIDENDGLLRVGGRIDRADIPHPQKHPIILPSGNHVTNLIIQDLHSKTYHSGIQSTLHSLRHKFWLLDGRTQVRKVIKRCVPCYRFKAIPVQYKMGDLPKARLEGGRAFENTGVDFCGPLLIKEKKFRNKGRVKAYVCVFVCMAVKAVHLEVVSDLSTEGFLAALRRFVARRGVPANIYSDNGTNFIGANNHLLEMAALVQSKSFQTQVHNFAVNRRIAWHFNPPMAPHFGGLWEAAVKSFKYHFRRVIGDRIFTFEEVNTFTIEIEAILNSRPLYPMSSDPNDPIALTPAHFLIGQPFTLLPEENLFLVPENRLKSWELIKQSRQRFWKRWQMEYLSELQKRQKWTANGPNLKPETMVLVIDKNRPCMQWRLGRVLEVHPGADGVVRTATIQSNGGKYKRAVKLLCPLPITPESCKISV